MTSRPDEKLIEALAQALHEHSHYGDALPWDTAEKHGGMREDSKQCWRDMAIRFTDLLAPKYGLALTYTEPRS